MQKENINNIKELFWIKKEKKTKLRNLINSYYEKTRKIKKNWPR